MEKFLLFQVPLLILEGIVTKIASTLTSGKDLNLVDIQDIDDLVNKKMSVLVAEKNNEITLLAYNSPDINNSEKYSYKKENLLNLILERIKNKDIRERLLTTEDSKYSFGTELNVDNEEDALSYFKLKVLLE